MSQSPLDEFHKEQVEAFASYMSSVRSIESRLKMSINEYNIKRVEAEQLIESNTASAAQLSKQRELEATKIVELDAQKREMLAKQKELEIELKQLAERNKKLDEKHKAQSEKHIQLTQWEDRLKVQERELEIEQRRNKYFEHRLNLVASDEKIKAELDKLEGKK